MNKQILSVCLGVATVAILLCLLWPAPRMTPARVLQFRSGSLIGNLGVDIERYIEKNGKRPSSLSDIVREPSNVVNRAMYFIIPGRVKESDVPPDDLAGEFRYEDHSDYILDTNQNSQLLIYEKPGVRGDDTVYYYRKGFGVWKLKLKTFKNCLETGVFPPPVTREKAHP